MIRDTTAADLPAVKAIYDEQVAHGIATFDTTPPPIEHWQGKIDSPDHFLVAEEDGQVLGYAFSTTYRPRAAYDRTKEVSVYLHADAQGRGLGRALYDVLLARLRTDGIHTVLAVIAQPNPASEALHRACGFTRVGVLPEVGHKLGRWVDTAFWALVLEDG
jgi:L-amino acid N-acyltransferase YncA